MYTEGFMLSTCHQIWAIVQLVTGQGLMNRAIGLLTDTPMTSSPCCRLARAVAMRCCRQQGFHAEYSKKACGLSLTGRIVLALAGLEAFGHTGCCCMAVSEPSLWHISGEWQLQFYEDEDTCQHMAFWVLTILKQVGSHAISLSEICRIMMRGVLM